MRGQAQVCIRVGRRRRPRVRAGLRAVLRRRTRPTPGEGQYGEEHHDAPHASIIRPRLRSATLDGVSAFKDPEIEISPQEADALLRSGEAVLVDVREQYEWDAGRIRGARHVELERLASQADTIPRDKRVIFQC